MTERQATRRRAASGRPWSYIAGEKGKNRVRVYERASFGLWIDYRDVDGKRVRQPLRHDDRERAKLKAEEVAAKFRRHGAAPTAMTLRTLFDIYEREVTPHKAESTQAHDRRTLPLFLKAFGANRLPETLNRRDWDSYIARRRSGKFPRAEACGRGKWCADRVNDARTGFKAVARCFELGRARRQWARRRVSAGPKPAQRARDTERVEPATPRRVHG